MKQKNQEIFENISLVIWKVAIASALSWEVAKLTGSNHPYLAPLTVILCLKANPNRTIRFSFHRMIGTIIGIFLIIFFYKYIQINGWMLGLLILGGSFITKWMKLDKTVIEQVALSILLVFVLGHQSGEYASDRIKDTFIGAVLAILVNVYFFPNFFTQKAASTYNEYYSMLSSLFLEFSNWILGGCDPVKGREYQNQLKKYIQDLHPMKKDLKMVSKVFSYFPFCKQKSTVLQEYHQKTKMLSNGYIYLLDVVVTFKEWGSSHSMTVSDKETWANQMKVLNDGLERFEKKKELSFPPKGLLQVSLKAEQQKQQYHIAIYQETKQFCEEN
ncbi:FUSC family protein [Heyndrickxia sp. NPDC080065]|uniref:FUSC family protein n=1 Tax=Heyndrickxia sp. NPDC080065 TaxID=3390568 RepID=UPI003D028C4A